MIKKYIHWELDNSRQEFHILRQWSHTGLCLETEMCSWPWGCSEVSAEEEEEGWSWMTRGDVCDSFDEYEEWNRSRVVWQSSLQGHCTRLWEGWRMLFSTSLSNTTAIYTLQTPPFHQKTKAQTPQQPILKIVNRSHQRWAWPAGVTRTRMHSYTEL